MTPEEAIAENDLLEDGRVTEEFRQSVIIDLKYAREQCTALLTGTAGPTEAVHEGQIHHVKDHEERGRLLAIRILLNDTLRTLEAEI